MKKIIIILTIALISFKGKTQVPDTVRYLIDSIKGKENQYLGKPLSVLLKSLKIQPIEYQGILPNPKRYKDTILFRYTHLDFYDLDRRLERKFQKNTPSIYIEFAQPIQIPKILFYNGGILEGYHWDRVKRNYFGQYIISRIEIRGI